MGESLLSVRNLCLRRGGRELFRNVEFSLAAGDALLVTGPNGSGKSSLLRCLAGLLPAAGGSIDAVGGIAYLGHENALKPARRLDEELRWWAAIDGTAARFAFGLEQLGEVPVRMLSAGQRRRAALARTIASGARIWLLDEPGAGLDAANIAALAAAIAEHRDGGGVAVIASHGETPVPVAQVLPL